MIEIELIGGETAALRAAAEAALSAVGIAEGHLAVAVVDAHRITGLNREYRGLDRPTDVLSFPVDETGPVAGPRELGDVVICPEHTQDLEEAVVHGVLHLCGYDHEIDAGEMLVLQDSVMVGLARSGARSSIPTFGRTGGGAPQQEIQ